MSDVEQVALWRTLSCVDEVSATEEVLNAFNYYDLPIEIRTCILAVPGFIEPRRTRIAPGEKV